MNMHQFKNTIKHFQEKYQNRLEQFEKGEQIDSEKYSKHHYWQLGYHNGLLRGLEIAEEILEDLENED